MSTEIDQRPGFYYVDCTDAGKVALLAGPYAKHADALNVVEAVRREAEKVDFKSCFYAFGTCRSVFDLGLGKLNDSVGYVASRDFQNAG